MYRNSAYIMTRIIDPFHKAKPAQIGVDLTVAKIQHIYPGFTEKLSGDICNKKIVGYLDASGKMHMSPNIYGVVPLEIVRNEDGAVTSMWKLQPGVYAVEFEQGLLPLAVDENAYIIQRSSLNRVGTRIEGSIFDPGFTTETLGATMFVWQPICIEPGARVAQITIATNEPADNMYNGTWQGKGNQ